MTNPTIEVLRVRANAILEMTDPKLKPALLAALMEDAGAVKVTTGKAKKGFMPNMLWADEGTYWLLPIQDGEG